MISLNTSMKLLPCFLGGNCPHKNARKGECKFPAILRNLKICSVVLWFSSCHILGIYFVALLLDYKGLVSNNFEHDCLGLDSDNKQTNKQINKKGRGS